MTIRREDLKRGQTVYVRIRGITSDPATVKLRAARVLDVLRAAVVLQAEGETLPRTVRFNEIETEPRRPAASPSQDGALKAVPEAFAKLATQAQPEKVASPVAQPMQAPPEKVSVERTPRRLPTTPPPAPTAAAPAPSATPVMDAMNAWLQQGSGLLDTLHGKQAALTSEIDAIAAEMLKLEETLAAKRAELERVTSAIVGMEKVRAAMEAA